MTDDLVKQLLADELPNDGQREKEARIVLHLLLKEAAVRIEKLEAALRPFAERYLWPDDSCFAEEIQSDEDWDKQKSDQQVDDMWIERGWIRAARKALEKKDG